MKIPGVTEKVCKIVKGKIQKTVGTDDKAINPMDKLPGINFAFTDIAEGRRGNFRRCYVKNFVVFDGKVTSFGKIQKNEKFMVDKRV